jgi:hypothetical protein
MGFAVVATGSRMTCEIRGSPPNVIWLARLQARNACSKSAGGLMGYVNNASIDGVMLTVFSS